jgi:hypothetical protein
MMELAVAAFHSHLNPAVIFQQIDQFLDFHFESLHAMQKWRIGMTHNDQAQGRAACGASLWSAESDSLWPLNLDFAIVGETVAQVEVDKALVRNAGFFGHTLEVLHNII